MSIHRSKLTYRHLLQKQKRKYMHNYRSVLNTGSQLTAMKNSIFCDCLQVNKDSIIYLVPYLQKDYKRSSHRAEKNKQNVSIAVVSALCCQQDQLLFYNSKSQIKRSPITVQKKNKGIATNSKINARNIFHLSYGALLYSGRIIIKN